MRLESDSSVVHFVAMVVYFVAIVGVALLLQERILMRLPSDEWSWVVAWILAGAIGHVSGLQLSKFIGSLFVRSTSSSEDEDESSESTPEVHEGISSGEGKGPIR